MPSRWEGDQRGHGVADASKLAPGIQELLELSKSPNWIAEAPELHLLPHLQRACDMADSLFTLQSTDVDSTGAFIVNLGWRGESAAVAQIRAAVLELTGHIAEAAIYIRQRREPLTYEVVTGIPASDGAFDTHGHVVILRVAPQP
jgi:hypothetical protein